VRNLTRGNPCKAPGVGALIALAALVFTLPSATVMAQTGYKYRDANGQWVFTDQAPASGAANDSFSLGPKDSTLHLAVDRNDEGESTQLIAINECLCVVTFKVAIIESGVAAIPDGAKYLATLEPGTRQILVRGTRAGTAKAVLNYFWMAVLGSPDAVHNPPRPYRVPFGVGSTYLISQAFPSRITHTTPDSEYAVDIALPDGTPIYAAREGTVINARHDSFRGAAAPVMLDQANVIEILHDDGTIGLYAPLALGFDPRANRRARSARAVHCQLRQHWFYVRATLAFRRPQKCGRGECIRPDRIRGNRRRCPDTHDSNAVDGVLELTAVARNLALLVRRVVSGC